MSVIVAPLAFCRKRGVPPPTDLKARTGLFTPPGSRVLAVSKAAFERGLWRVCVLVIFRGLSKGVPFLRFYLADDVLTFRLIWN